jgi:Domain of unknown function (DUF4145)
MRSGWELGNAWGYQSDEKVGVWRVTCAFCNEKSNFALAHHGEKKKPNSDKLPWPFAPKRELSANWPEGMKRFPIQAHDSLTNENCDAGNVRVRGALQFVLRTEKAAANALLAQINHLAVKSVLHPLMEDGADEVRILANQSAHPEAPIPKDATLDSRDIVRFFDLLLPRLYDLPKQTGNYRKPKTSAGVNSEFQTFCGTLENPLQVTRNQIPAALRG